MNYSRRIALIGLTVLVFASIVGPHPVRGDAIRPAVAVGDQWKYSIQGTEEGVTLQGTLTQTIVSEERVAAGSNSYEAYKYSLGGSGSASVPGLTGTWTMSGSDYVRRSDLAEIKANISMDVSFFGVSVTQVIEATSTPPIKQYDFPLLVEKVGARSIRLSSIPHDRLWPEK